VVGVPQDPVGDYPGTPALNAFADRHCGTAFSEHTGRPFDGARDSYLWFAPDASDFKTLHGTVLCVGVTADGSELTGPLGG